MIQQILNQLVNLGSLVIISSYIKPDVHGFIAIATIGVTLTSVLGSIGLNEIIIKDKTNNFKDNISSYLGIIVLLSFFFFLISIIFGFVISLIYQDNFDFLLTFKYATILAIIAPLAPYRSFIESLRTKDLDFKKLSILQITSLFIGIIPSIVLAYFNYGYESLTTRLILPHLLFVISGFIIFKIPFKLKFSKRIFFSIKDFAKYYSFNNIINYFVRNIDYMILGKFFSPSVLGQYVLAYKILLLPLKTVSGRVVQVGMPLLAKLEYESKKFKRYYFIMVEAISFIVFPSMIFLSFNSSEITYILFNNEYPILGDLIKYLAIVGAIQSIISPVGMLFYFKNNTKLMFLTSLLTLLFAFLSFYISSKFGDIFIVVISYCFVYSFLILPNSVLWIYKKYKFKLMDLFSSTLFSIPSLLVSIFIQQKFLTNIFESNFLNMFFGFIFYILIFIIASFIIYYFFEKPKIIPIILKKFKTYVRFRRSF